MKYFTAEELKPLIKELFHGFVIGCDESGDDWTLMKDKLTGMGLLE